MKFFIVIGVAFIVLGIVALVDKGITYTTKEKILDLGPIEATATKDKTVPLSPLVGVVSLLGGLTLIIVGSKNASAE